MIGATLFSGIGAPETAMPSWCWAWGAETDRFASAVLAARHPSTVNLGDVTAHDFIDRAIGIARPDVIVFGSPCQDFSVAGKRDGMAGARGNLALAALDIIAGIEPRWFVFENVPGLLSSAEGRDFGLFLRAVDDIGYSACWAVLDAQYFGVAQRRRRLFVVGHSGDWRGPASVLLEPESVCGDSPPRREAGEGFTCDIASSLGSRGNRSHTELDGHGAYIAFDTTQMTSALNRSQPRPGDPCHPLAAGAHPPAIAFDARQSDVIQYGDRTGPLDTDGTSIAVHSGMAVALCEGGHGLTEMGITTSLQSQGGKAGQGYQAIRSGMAVRRLTPVECERLQGFPDGYTSIPYRGKPAADGPRYKALGNSMAVPCVRWILSRIEAVSA